VAHARQPIVLVSTSEVYGKSARAPFAEDDDLVLGATTHSRWAYACSKALDEWLALAYAREQGLPVIVARLFNTVGPRQSTRYGMVLPIFAAQAVRNEPLTVFGSGEQTRCFAHVKDVVEAIRRLAEAPGAVGQIFNIGSDREVTINRLAAMVRAAAGSSSPIVHVPYAEAYGPGFEDMLRRVPNVAKLERTIGFRPTTSLEQIITDVVAEQRRLLIAG
jgi:UDP-glucose 4-epimerase